MLQKIIQGVLGPDFVNPERSFPPGRVGDTISYTIDLDLMRIYPNEKGRCKLGCSRLFRS